MRANYPVKSYHFGVTNLFTLTNNKLYGKGVFLAIWECTKIKIWFIPFSYLLC